MTDYDLVLCDIKMPKMDGEELLEAVKKIKPEIPIVMISGHGDMETAINTMRLGAFDYISKPPDLNRFKHRSQRFRQKTTRSRKQNSKEKSLAKTTK
jgi:DNA-binding NtrC family response regulator